MCEVQSSVVMATMARLVLCALALLVAGRLAEPVRNVQPQRTADPAFLQMQVELMDLYYHIHEPTFVPEQMTIASTWDIEKNIEHYSNVTAVKIYVEMIEEDYLLPRAVPFTILNPVHQFEAVTLFNVLYSAKDYSTFYRTAVYLRNRVNEELYVYVLSAAILHRRDTQGVVIPPIYDIFPSFFNNGEIMTTAQRINTHGRHWVEQFPSTYIWNDNVVIRWNETVWPYHSEDLSIVYFTHDHELNTYYYNQHLAYPFWLGGETCPLVNDRRGEWFWFIHKQLLTRYYMERLSNGLGEIPVLGLDVVQTGHTPGLLYHNGIPFPARPAHYHLDQPHLVDDIIRITDYERRIRDAIEQGYIINNVGEHINIMTPEGIDILGRVIEANVDSPNVRYYRDFISLWRTVLGNSFWREHAVYHNEHVPLVLPSTLEHWQTSLRDPAFYMIWKRVMSLFQLWSEQLPPYRPEELALPSVHLQRVDVDRLQTYFEYTYLNVTNDLHLNQHEIHSLTEDVTVLVQHPQLNHKTFQVRLHVQSDVAQTVVVRLFLAPKYDSLGYEIPLHRNTENFFLMDQFTYDLPQGQHVIHRDSNENMYTIDDWHNSYEVYTMAENALHGNSQFVLDQSHRFNGFPQRFILPMGRVGGMPFVLLAYISEYRAPRVPYGTGFDPAMSLGLGSGAVRMTDDPIGFPLNRPLHQWQIKDLHNLVIQDVNIYHKPNPDVWVPHTEEHVNHVA